jgi:hypothetical protein
MWNEAARFADFFRKNNSRKRRRFIPFITNNNVILNEFPEPVEGNEVKNLFDFEKD